MIGVKLQEASLALHYLELISELRAMLETKDMLQVSLGRVHRWNLSIFFSADLAQR